jgi:hypothetical protein
MIHKRIIQNIKLSSVTTCMNRVESIKQTLIENIKASGHLNVDFVLLNYGSKDGLEEYIKETCMPYIFSGKLKYYRVLDNIEFFHHARAKNIAYKLSSGNLVFNSDAEWFSYSSLFNLVFEEFKTGEENKTLHIGGRGGALVNYKKHFEMIHGYNEEMVGWGFEDSDFFNRLRYGFNFEHKRTDFSPYGSIIWRAHPKRDSTNIPKDLIKWNYKIHKQNIARKKFIANEGNTWGSAKVLLNFKEEIQL